MHHFQGNLIWAFATVSWSTREPGDRSNLILSLSKEVRQRSRRSKGRRQKIKMSSFIGLVVICRYEISYIINHHNYHNYHRIRTSPLKHHHWHLLLGLQGPLTQELRTRELGPGRCLLGLCHGRWRRSAGLWTLNTSTDGATAVINSTVVQNPQRVQAMESARNDVFRVCCKRSSCSS